jgi:hypothetical protein
MRQALRLDFAQFGLEIMQVQIENISLPPEVEAALDKRTQMGLVGNLNDYTRFQAANAIEQSAKNPGSGGNPAIDVAMGVALGQQIVRGLQTGDTPSTAAPPPLPQPDAPLFFTGVGGKQQGPFSLAALREQVASGALTRDTLVWKKGMVNWQLAGNVDDLAPLFAAVPPPLPS